MHTLVNLEEAMEQTPTSIQRDLKELYRTSRYDVGVISKLEDYLEEQIKTKTMDLAANLHLLQMYRMYPEKMNISKVAKLLVKAMMSMGERHFTACQYLVSEETREVQYKTGTGRL